MTFLEISNTNKYLPVVSEIRPVSPPLPDNNRNLRRYCSCQKPHGSVKFLQKKYFVATLFL